jgi:hypothetical protein
MLFCPIIDFVFIAYMFNCDAFLHQLPEFLHQLPESGAPMTCKCDNTSLGVSRNPQSLYNDATKRGQDQLELHLALLTWVSDGGVPHGSFFDAFFFYSFI